MEFKDRLRSLRSEKGVSTTALAAEFGKSDAAVRMWETGKSKPDIDTLIKLAEYFGCSTDYLLGFCDNKNNAYVEAVNEKLQNVADLLNFTKDSHELVSAWENILAGLYKLGDPSLLQCLNFLSLSIGASAIYSARIALKLREDDVAVKIQDFTESARIMETSKRWTLSIMAVFYGLLVEKITTPAIENAESSDKATLANIALALLGTINIAQAQDEMTTAYKSFVELGILPKKEAAVHAETENNP